jgi:hypothetical protein
MTPTDLQRRGLLVAGGGIALAGLPSVASSQQQQDRKSVV